MSSVLNVLILLVTIIFGFITKHAKPESHSNSPKPYVNTQVVSAGHEDADFCQRRTLGPLVRFSKESKFFADKYGNYNFEKANEMCKSYGLVLAELEDMVDQRSVHFFISRAIYHPEGTKMVFDPYYIATNDIDEEGFFRKGNRRSNITFQNFHRSQPDDKNQNEDCVVLHQELYSGPVGSSDISCNKEAHAICMYAPGSECYRESSESQEIEKTQKKHGLVTIGNVADRYIYYVSNYQTTWEEALKYCFSRSMKLFVLDHIVGVNFFSRLMKWQHEFAQVPTPTVEYWTAGKFQESHMTSPIFWYTEPILGHVTHSMFHNQSFSFSGVFRWSSKKSGDPGRFYGTRRDICVSFGFEGESDSTPVIRNTNCEMPCYFVCVEQKNDNEDY